MTGGKRVVGFGAGATAVAMLLAWTLGWVDDGQLAARVVAGAVGAVGVIWTLERLEVHEGRGDAFDAVWWRPRRTAASSEPPERARLRRMVRLATATAGDAHDRLRPMLREVADARLDARYGTHVDRDPRAAERLGTEVWDWVRPDRERPDDPLAPGPGPAELDQLLRALEETDDDWD